MASSSVRFTRTVGGRTGAPMPHAVGRGDEDAPALVTEVESLLERQLQEVIMRGGAKPTIREIKTGEVPAEQGTQGDELYLLLNRVLVVEVDGQQLAELGPRAVLGQRAALEGGARTATLRAVTDCKVAAVPAAAIDERALVELADGHRREGVDAGRHPE